MISQLKAYRDQFLKNFSAAQGFYLWIGFLIVVIMLGIYSLAMSFIHSMEIFEFYTNIPWEMMVSVYIYLVGSSVGLCLITSIGIVFHLKRFEILARRSLFLALLTIVFGLLSIGLHLGHPERGVFMTLTPNIRSAMWWMGILYPPYVVFIALTYWLVVRSDLISKAATSNGLKARVYRLLALEGLKTYLYRRFPLQTLTAEIHRRLPFKKGALSPDSDGTEIKWARRCGVAALVLALLAYTVEGSLFAHTEARPFWHGALFPIDFFLGALFCGLTWLMATSIITYHAKGQEVPSRASELYFELAELTALLLSAGLLFTTYKMAHGLFEPAKAKIIMLFLNGPFSIGFWVFEVTVGAVLPILIFLFSVKRRKLNGVLVASLMVLVGYFVKRYDFVVGSQVYPLIKQQAPLSTHFPTIMEVLLIGGILGALLLLYTIGAKFLPLKEERLPNSH